MKILTVPSLKWRPLALLTGLADLQVLDWPRAVSRVPWPVPRRAWVPGRTNPLKGRPVVMGLRRGHGWRMLCNGIYSYYYITLRLIYRYLNGNLRNYFFTFNSYIYIIIYLIISDKK